MSDKTESAKLAHDIVDRANVRAAMKVLGMVTPNSPMHENIREINALLAEVNEVLTNWIETGGGP